MGKASPILPGNYYYHTLKNDFGRTVGYATYKKVERGQVLSTILGPTMQPKGVNLGEIKAAEFAPGIPDKETVKSLPTEAAVFDTTFVVHEHLAEKAGKHFDLRLADKAGNAHSWALRYWPAVGEKRLAVQQPTHTREYMTFKGVIEDGYGKGQVNIFRSGHCEIRKMNDNEVVFHLMDKRNVEEFVLIRTLPGQKDWLLINKTSTRTNHDVVNYKPSMIEKSIEDADDIDDDLVVMPKYDGAHAVITLTPGKEKEVRVFSYRTPKSGPDSLIEYTHKIGPHLYDATVPTSLKDTVVRGEVWASKDGKPVPAPTVGGMLNASAQKSRELQKSNGQLKITMFDVIKFKGRDLEKAPFSEKLTALEEINKAVPHLLLPEIAKDKDNKKALIDKVRAGQHPDTLEGVITRSLSGSGKTKKLKIRSDYDVYVRGIFQAISKDNVELDRAGGFEYSWEESGPVVGRVGTGFDHQTLRDMLANQAKYIGRVAKVTARERYPTGALKEPSFYEWHLDKGKVDED